MKLAINFLVVIALLLTGLTTRAQESTDQQETAEQAPPVVAEESSEEAETPPKDTNQLLQELLIQLQKQNLRDPFAPDAAILKEQRRANNEFVEVGPGVSIPEVSLVGVISLAPPEDTENEKASADEENEAIEPSETKVASIRVEGRVYFVREKDRVTLTRSSGNLVIEIDTISNGFVEVKLGTLAESVIIR
ncbi:MAG: hypothetical protein VX776_00520 [Planctomycetota bacterium]|nr:hypothetical protein [Planctomycetota bacterium]